MNKIPHEPQSNAINAETEFDSPFPSAYGRIPPVSDTEAAPARETRQPPDFLLPQPNTRGIERTKELYARKYGREISDAEAAEALGKVMRYLYLINNPQCSTSENTAASLTTTRQSPRSRSETKSPNLPLSSDATD